jgi:hypothetical protein
MFHRRTRTWGLLMLGLAMLASAGCDNNVLTRAARESLASFITDLVSETVDNSLFPGDNQ